MIIKESFGDQVMTVTSYRTFDNPLSSSKKNIALDNK
jgi:hypothetical protein